jgi:hypothetical protein
MAPTVPVTGGLQVELEGPEEERSPRVVPARVREFSNVASTVPVTGAL